jgi:hypothetical protein
MFHHDRVLPHVERLLREERFWGILMHPFFRRRRLEEGRKITVVILPDLLEPDPFVPPAPGAVEDMESLVAALQNPEMVIASRADCLVGPRHYAPSSDWLRICSIVLYTEHAAVIRRCMPWTDRVGLSGLSSGTPDSQVTGSLLSDCCGHIALSSPVRECGALRDYIFSLF